MNETTMPKCPRCGGELSPGETGEICPRCAAALLQATATEIPGPAENRCGFVPPATKDIARLFPGLEVLQLLGHGGMGAVYKVRQKDLDRVVALKILPPGIGEDSASAERFARAGKVMGTPAYMAPEQAEHPADVNHLADIYALGVVLYQMLTGELPSKPLERPSKRVQIDVRLDEVVLRALEREPGRRYAQVSDFKTAVEEIGMGTAAEAAVNSSTSHSSQAARERLPLALILVATLFLLVGSSAVWDSFRDFQKHFYTNFNLALLALPTGIGLLRRRPGWRRFALACVWMGAAFLIFVGLMFAGQYQPAVERSGMMQFKLWGKFPPLIPGLILLAPIAGLLIWIYRVLVRAEVRTLFWSRSWDRVWIEWSALAAALLLPGDPLARLHTL